MNIGAKFDLLTSLPLMQGICGKELADIEGALGLDVLKCDGKGCPIVRQGETCTSLIFVVNGIVRREYTSHDGTFKTASYMDTPTVLEPHNLYGIRCHYGYTYIPEDKAGIISVDKHHVNSYLMKSEIFRLNYMNMVCSALQKLRARQAVCQYAGPEEKIKSLLRDLFEGCVRSGEVAIKMTDLADMILETRLNTSRALNDMQDAGLMVLKRSKVVLPDVNKLFNLL